jgi:hypothetical protein
VRLLNFSSRLGIGSPLPSTMSAWKQRPIPPTPQLRPSRCNLSVSEGWLPRNG